MHSIDKIKNRKKKLDKIIKYNASDLDVASESAEFYSDVLEGIMFLINEWEKNDYEDSGEVLKDIKDRIDLAF